MKTKGLTTILRETEKQPRNRTAFLHFKARADRFGIGYCLGVASEHMESMTIEGVELAITALAASISVMKSQNMIITTGLTDKEKESLKDVGIGPGGVRPE